MHFFPVRIVKMGSRPRSSKTPNSTMGQSHLTSCYVRVIKFSTMAQARPKGSNTHHTPDL